MARSHPPDLPRLAPKEELVLRVLIEGKEMYGLQIVERANGALKRGTVYVLLGRLEEKGFIVSRRDRTSSPEAVLPRRLYRLTGLGERTYSAWASARAALGGRFAWSGGI